MGEVAAKSDEAVAQLQAGLTDLASQVTLLATNQQQINGQLDLAHRAATDHLKFTDNIERRHDALAQQMQALGQAMEQLAASRGPSRAENDGDPLQGLSTGRGIFRPAPQVVELDAGQMEPEEVLDRRLVKKGNAAIPQSEAPSARSLSVCPRVQALWLPLIGTGPDEDLGVWLRDEDRMHVWLRGVPAPEPACLASFLQLMM
ncbi:hypothetical protein QYE76_008514 [Lolium multiflorum]|uniref:Uncharacterized protein n=1 Tax=Lolium multiflorum TaxID=4521 RepID=A0AAD8X2A5_LOLMU|nr:hypothetical protein QYE76_008514 [Lolium multiflorum]